MPRINVGDVVAVDEQTIQGNSVTIPNRDRMVHLQFRRFAGCPICNLHLAEVARRHGEIHQAGINEVVVFHSTADSMLPYQGRLPFAAIADPDKSLYADFGVGSSPKAVLDPRVWGAFARGAIRQRSLRSSLSDDAHLGLPADFLIGTDGTVRAVRYGQHANDQWTVDDILRLSHEQTAGPRATDLGERR